MISQKKKKRKVKKKINKINKKIQVLMKQITLLKKIKIVSFFELHDLPFYIKFTFNFY